MATVEQCRQALGDIATRLASDPAAAARVNLDRSLACHIRDLNVSFHGRLRGGTVEDLTDGDEPNAQIRLTIGSDDLVALVAGQLNFAAALASGKASIKASFTDLLKLRKLL
jgi:alkyl sulfatase BDS1-like metallo-beta-lactamase superfamily hydrolase